MARNLLQRSKTGTPSPVQLQVGGPGNDVFFVTDPGETVLDASSADRDVVYASVNWTMTGGSRLEVLSAVSQAAGTPLQLTGNEFFQEIYGNAGDNVLDGGGGADYMAGFGGNDIYFVSHGSDYIAEGANGGRDVVYARLSYTLTAGAEVEVLSTASQASTVAMDLVGNALRQEIYGNDGANIIEGGGGADYLQGYGGNDIYIVDHGSDYIVEAAGGGRDVVYARVNYILTAGAEVEVVSAISQAATTPLELSGNELFNEIYGNAGANIIDGGAGADYLAGLGGDDIYFVDHGSDYIVESAGGGRDVVYAKTSYTLTAGAEVEVLSVASAGPGTVIDLTGNELANELYGNAEANYLDGGAGADYLQGYAGNDSYVVDTQGDVVVEGAGEGSRDVVFARVSYTLGAGQQIEVLSTISGSATTAIDLTGNELANELYGNNGANVLNGGLGADYLMGNGGADTFAFTTALGGGNVDQIADFVVGVDKILLGGAGGEPFAALASGTLRAGTLVLGAAAADADDYLIYNSATGALLFDADGAGGAAAVQFATLGTGLSLTVADFLVSGPANTAPAITSGATASVAENSNVSTIVYQTVAGDADGDRITWSLSGTDAGLLSIDANGAVRLLSSPDFETKTSYSFNVIASDSGAATLKAVILTITDVNDTAARRSSTRPAAPTTRSRLRRISIRERS